MNRHDEAIRTRDDKASYGTSQNFPLPTRMRESTPDVSLDDAESCNLIPAVTPPGRGRARAGRRLTMRRVGR